LGKGFTTYKGDATKQTIELFLRHRRWLLLAIVVVTALLAYSSRALQVDNTLKGVNVVGSPESLDYQRFVRQFGDDELLLVVLFNKSDVYDQTVLRSLAVITRDLGKLDKVASVFSLATVRSIRDRGGLLSSSPLLTESAGRLLLPPSDKLRTILAAIPKSDLLLSRDPQDRWNLSPSRWQGALRRQYGASYSDGSHHRCLPPSTGLVLPCHGSASNKRRLS
jgi:hypothetical protein